MGTTEESCQVQSGCGRVWALPQHWRDVTVTVKMTVKMTVKVKVKVTATDCDGG